MEQLLGLLPTLLDFANVALSSVVVILAFSLLAYTLTYNFRDSVAQWFALLLACVVIVFAAEVALDRVANARPPIAGCACNGWALPSCPRPITSFRLPSYVQRIIACTAGAGLRFLGILLSLVSAIAAFFTNLIVGVVHYSPPISYLEAGPYFWLFAVYFVAAIYLSLANVWKARERCLTDRTRQRMTYLMIAFIAPGVGIFPYLIGLSRIAGAGESSALVLILAILVNCGVATMLVVMAYTVAYFGVLTPDRVVRYRLCASFSAGLWWRLV